MLAIITGGTFFYLKRRKTKLTNRFRLQEPDPYPHPKKLQPPTTRKGHDLRDACPPPPGNSITVTDSESDLSMSPPRSPPRPENRERHVDGGPVDPISLERVPSGRLPPAYGDIAGNSAR
ncbi:hypothetical protein AAF712_012953 [Marasmius tenuissimus]|uniref:Uncharacterized protein n=1 Tax=Marasmius tenuissimus TaxID=585030 RepID=A0ABR2ZIK7_9AGAR|nr:hypothetical protein PM082_024177 [Marasmius tenuissimus]